MMAQSSKELWVKGRNYLEVTAGVRTALPHHGFQVNTFHSTDTSTLFHPNGFLAVFLIRNIRVTAVPIGDDTRLTVHSEVDLGNADVLLDEAVKVMREEVGAVEEAQ